jgi:5-methylcytosine-specific restriction endonuclease McrA
MDAPDETKICPRCGRILSVAEFRGGSLNLASEECTDCVWNRMCKVTEADFNTLDERVARYSLQGKTGLDVFRQSFRRYRGDDLYRTLERIRSRLAPDPRRRGFLARAEAGYVGFASQLRQRRTRRHGAGGWHTAADVQRLHDEQGGLCCYCGKELKGRYEIDHKTPLSRGGTDWPENICCACESCNSRKQTKTAEEFMEYLATLRRRQSSGH